MELCNPEQSYKTLSTVVWDCKYHIIFSPKFRRPVLTDDIEARLKELIIEKQQEYGYEIIEMEVMPDHVHLLLSIAPDKPIRKVVSNIKGYTAKTIRSEFPHLKTKMPSLWTRSAFISSVGAVSLATVQKYIANQKHLDRSPDQWQKYTETLN